MVSKGANMSLIKSPLRYPGGKSRAVKFLYQYFPKDFKIYKEPFFGGGSVGIYIAQTMKNIKIYANDLNYELYCFWNSLKMQPDKLIEGIVELKSKFKNGKDLYNFILYRRDFNLSMLERGIDFFILNRITFSGIVDSGGFSQKAYESRFTISSIDRLKNTYRVIKNFNFSCDNFFNLVNSDLDNQKDIFIFLDPPYYSSIKSKLYGKKGILHSNFNHENLRDYLYQTKSKFLLTYDNCEYIKELYKDFYMLEWNLQYGMNNYKQKNADIGKELLISNYDLKFYNNSSYDKNVKELYLNKRLLSFFCS